MTRITDPKSWREVTSFSFFIFGATPGRDVRAGHAANPLPEHSGRMLQRTYGRVFPKRSSKIDFIKTV